MNKKTNTYSKELRKLWTVLAKMSAARFTERLLPPSHT